MKLLADDISLRTLSHMDHYFAQDPEVLNSMIGITAGEELKKLTLVAISRHKSLQSVDSQHKVLIAVESEILSLMVELNSINSAESITDILDVGGDALYQLMLRESITRFNTVDKYDTPKPVTFFGKNLILRWISDKLSVISSH